MTVSYQTMNGKDKAAILVMCLSPDMRKKLLGSLSGEEINCILRKISDLEKVPNEALEGLTEELVSKIKEGKGILVGGNHLMEKILQESIPSSLTEEILEAGTEPSTRNVWRSLSNVNENTLAYYLKNERPQTVSVILSHIKPEHASSTLMSLPHSFAGEVIFCMMEGKRVEPSMLRKLEETLKSQFMMNLPKGGKWDAHSKVANIISMMDKNNEERFIKYIESKNRTSAERIRSLMFVFEDMLRMDKQTVPVFLRVVDNQKLAIALKSASEPLKNLLLGSMSERARKIIKGEMENMGPMRLRDVEFAQTELISLAKEMEARGEIMFLDSEEDMYVE